MTARVRFHHLMAAVIPVLVAAAPPPPVGVASYIHNGRFEPGDYGWLRGEFDGATPDEVAAFQAMIDWRKHCRTSDMAETRAELAGVGVNAGASLDHIPYRSLVCSQVSTQPEPVNLHDWAGFARDVAVVQPIAQGFSAAVSMGEKAAQSDRTALRDELDGRSTGEQMLRAGMSWALDPSSDDAPAIDLTPQQRGILVSELSIALETRDHANTAWLKGIVAARGWPKRSQVGESAAKTAWLLVQHADADPAFQVRVLHLMEPLVPAGEVDQRGYAYLYDRVMVKVVGKQRYGTQLTCQNGQLVPLPMESALKVDSVRHAVGMPTLVEYEAQVLKEDGPCQNNPVD